MNNCMPVHIFKDTCLNTKSLISRLDYIIVSILRKFTFASAHALTTAFVHTCTVPWVVGSGTTGLTLWMNDSSGFSLGQPYLSLWPLKRGSTHPKVGIDYIWTCKEILAGFLTMCTFMCKSWQSQGSQFKEKETIDWTCIKQGIQVRVKSRCCDTTTEKWYYYTEMIQVSAWSGRIFPGRVFVLPLGIAGRA